jgi:hypothetical protein
VTELATEGRVTRLEGEERVSLRRYSLRLRTLAADVDPFKD